MKLIVLLIGVSLLCILIFIVKRKKPSEPARNDNQDLEIFAMAQLLQERGQLDEAEDAYRQVSLLNPDFSPAANALGALLAKSGRLEEAETYFREVVRLNPDAAWAHKNLGLVLYEGGWLSDAEASFREALAIQPDDSDTLDCLAGLLAQSFRLDEAEDTYRLALKARPNNIDALNNLGTFLRKNNHMGEAEATYRQALALKPDSALTLNNLGALFMSTARLQEAEAAYRKALQLEPNHPEASYNFGMLSLLKGDYEQGWKTMEQRLQAGIMKQGWREFSRPRWDGLAYPGKTLLVHCEQGAGDSIQFFRYLAMLASLGGSLVVECPPPLFRLFRANLPVEVQLVNYMEALPGFDMYCPLMSLPLHFQTRLETIPANVPYINPPIEALANAPVLLPLPEAPIKVGVVWAGSPSHLNNQARSLDFSLLEPLFAVAGITWVILQLEHRAEGFELLVDQYGWLDPMGRVKDFADTAAIISQLDLVIGVDTSVIHLAGAMGKPVWLLLSLLPDWRWLLNREDSPWYPGMRLFRQAAIDTWPVVIQRVVDELPTKRDALLQTKSYN